MSLQFHNLTVSDVKQETKDAVSLTFDVPTDLKETFQFTQGQYITLRFDINGKDVRRAYSMCSSPLENRVTVTIKRVKNGLVSNHIGDKVKVSDTIRVMPPQGRFFTDLKEEQQKTYYLFGGGSGITPLMSILKTVIEKEPKSNVVLFYGNYNEDAIIFKAELESLEQKYAGQVKVVHILSDPIREKPSGFASFLKKGKINWTGKIGLADAKNTGIFLDENPAQAKDVEYFICGPGPMMDAIEGELKRRGIDKDKVHIERFSSTPPHEQKEGAAASGSGAKVRVHLDGKVVDLDLPAGKTILDGLLDLKLDPPYSCTSGSCSTCMAKVLNGNVRMDACYALDDDEVEEGFILTCQAHPTTEEVELTFDI